ncbi:MAG TPA: phosphoribosylanthranilate isomerase [bacterium]
MVRVKICGITDPAAAAVAAAAGADAIGLIFAPSRRRVTVERAREIVGTLPPFVAKVGVFVDETRERIVETVEAVGLDTVQLHGSETPGFAGSFALPVLKAIRVRDEGSLATLDDYAVAAYLLDTFDPELLGGTGRTFDWALAAAAALRHRILLSGGLRPDNVLEALDRVRPYGVDVSSGVETSGVKDHAKIREFVHLVREWDARRSRTALRG